jgi:hypothetical protein
MHIYSEALHEIPRILAASMIADQSNERAIARPLIVNA